MEDFSYENIPAPEPEEKKNPAWMRFLLDALETILLSIILFLVINAISARVRVDGFSMRPTLNDGEYVLVNKLAYRFGEPERGDIIVFRFPIDPTEDFIKRVIGLPGDQIVIDNGNLAVNGMKIDEPYIAAAPQYAGQWEVPEGNLFVLGDNRNDSSDSHAWGVLPVENVIGKAILIYWPPTDWNFIDHPQVVVAAP